MYICTKCQNGTKITKRSYNRNIKRNGIFLCQTCKIKSYIGPILTKRNKDFKFINRTKDKLREYWNSEQGQERKDLMRTNQYKNRLSKQAKKAWDNPTYRKTHCAVSRRNINNPDFVNMLHKSS